MMPGSLRLKGLLTHGALVTKVVPLTLVLDSSGLVLHARSQAVEAGSAAVDSILTASVGTLE